MLLREKKKNSERKVVPDRRQIQYEAAELIKSI